MAQVGTSKLRGNPGLHNKPLGFGASEVYASGPACEEEEEVNYSRRDFVGVNYGHGFSNYKETAVLPEGWKITDCGQANKGQSALIHSEIPHNFNMRHIIPMYITMLV